MVNPVLLEIPEEFETSRLLIRAPRPGDGSAVNEAILETFEDLHRWMPWAKQRPSVADSEEYARRAHAKFLTREDLTLRLIHKETGLMLGSSGLHPRGWEVPKFEIGYWCRKRFVGQGYITEAVRGILEFGFERVGAKRIEVRSDASNQRSIRVAQRAGLKPEAELRNDSRDMQGALRNTLVFALTDEDWRH